MTSETYPLVPIDVCFDISFTPPEIYRSMLSSTGGDCTSDLSNSYLEVTVSDNSIYSNTLMLDNVVNVI